MTSGNNTVPIRRRQGAFTTSTDLPAVRMPLDPPRVILQAELTRVTMNAQTSNVLIASALTEIGLDDVPTDRDLLELLLRSYIVPRLVGHGTMAAITRMLERTLAPGSRN